MACWQQCFSTTVWKSHCECSTVHAELCDAILKEEEGEVYYCSRPACATFVLVIVAFGTEF